MLDTKKKQRVIKKFATHEGDTGSSEVQIAILSSEIEELIDHLKKHPKDHSSRRGLLKKVSVRRKLLRYLKKENLKSYDELTTKLKLKKARQIDKTKEDILEVDELIGDEDEKSID
jgi:small subunit ribosomal protein S15